MEVADRSSAIAGLSRASYKRLAAYIEGELGIKMPDVKQVMVESRLLRRARDLRIASLDEYTEYFFAASHTLEREQFINAITTNKTDFFREPAHFDFLRRVALPDLERRREREWQLKLWSAGCSSGEEPYTLAMVLSEYAGDHRGFDFRILGTDVSTRVLEAARHGIYQQSQIAPAPAQLRSKYVWRSRSADGLVRIAPHLRRKITFHALNFMAPDYRISDMFDVIFFRNVMIYFDRPTQEAVINKMCRNLMPGGYLFAGHSESLAGLNIPVHQVHPSVFQKPLD